MGVLGEGKKERVVMTPAVVAARRMAGRARATYLSLVSAFNDGAKDFWQNPRATPQEIADALGTDARELFELHAKIGAMISGINPADIQPGKSVVGKFLFKPDGRVEIEA